MKVSYSRSLLRIVLLLLLLLLSLLLLLFLIFGKKRAILTKKWPNFVRYKRYFVRYISL